MFYGNKCTASLQNFYTSLSMTEKQEGEMVISMKDVPSSIDVGEQIQQIVDVECKNIFMEAPRVEIKFK